MEHDFVSSKFDVIFQLQKEKDPQWNVEFQKLTNEEKIKFMQLGAERNRIASQEERKNWTFDQWKAHAFTNTNLIASRVGPYPKDQDLKERIARRGIEGANELFSFFNNEDNSIFLNTYKCKFKGAFFFHYTQFRRVLHEQGYPLEVEFSSVEQFSSLAKAMVGIDLEIAKAILTTEDPVELNALCAKISKFIPSTWDAVKWGTIYHANRYKFTQNRDLQDALFATKGTTLVYANPDDNLWGIGLTKDDPKAQQRSTWCGKNLLGEVLTELRKDLMGHY